MKNLIQGKYYEIPFIEPYTEKGPYFVEISAIAKKETLPIYGDFDIRGAFFDKVGIKTYLQMVTDTTNIFICHIIKSTDPIEVDIGDFIFIPETIVDYSKLEEYLISKRIGINIDGIRRQFDSVSEHKDFINRLGDLIPKAVNNISLTANDLVSISTKEDDILLSNSVLNRETKDRNNIVKERESQEYIQKKYISDRETDYYKRIKKLEKDENEVVNLKAQYLALKNEAETNKTAAIDFLEKVNGLKSKMQDVYNILYDRSVELGMPIETWDFLENSMNYSQEEWDQYLDSIRNI